MENKMSNKLVIKPMKYWVKWFAITGALCSGAAYMQLNVLRQDGLRDAVAPLPWLLSVLLFAVFAASRANVSDRVKTAAALAVLIVTYGTAALMLYAVHELPGRELIRFALGQSILYYFASKTANELRLVSVSQRAPTASD